MYEVLIPDLEEGDITALLICYNMCTFALGLCGLTQVSLCLDNNSQDDNTTDEVNQGEDLGLLSLSKGNKHQVSSVNNKRVQQNCTWHQRLVAYPEFPVDRSNSRLILDSRGNIGDDLKRNDDENDLLVLLRQEWLDASL